MKLLVYAVIIGLVAGGTALWLNNMANQETESLRLGCDLEKEDGTCAFNIVLMGNNIRREPPEVDDHGTTLWDQWIQSHVQIVDENNTPVVLSFNKRSNMVNQAQQTQLAMAEGFLIGTLTVGRQYKMIYTPELAAGKNFVLEFTAGAESFPFKSRFLELK